MAARHVKKESSVEVRSAGKSFLASLYEYAETILFAMLLLVVVFTFLCRVAGVVGDSMVPTLQTNEKLLLVTHFYEPAYKDIVVIDRYTQEPLIKRVIGVAGDTIRIESATGVVYRNGEPLTETYISAPTDCKDLTEPVTVPEGYIFVLGDNRPVSKDSRSEEIGLVSVEDVVGKAVWRVWPFDRFGALK